MSENLLIRKNHKIKKIMMKEIGTKAIPAARRQILNDPNELPDQYSASPGGTLYGTTPGGTRIIYERNFLLNLKNSPLARSPVNMAFIPGITNIEPTEQNHKYDVLDRKKTNNNKINVKNNFNKTNNNNININNKDNKNKNHRDEQPQFDIDI